MNIKKKAFTSLSWAGLLRGSTRIIAYGKLAILARLLSPNEFGYYGIALLTLSFLEIFTQTGINVFFIQGEGKIKEYISTAWVVSIARGMLMSLLIYLMARPVSNFFSSPESYRFLVLTSLVPLIRGFINPSIIRFRKDLEYRKEFIIRLFLFATDALVAVGVVYLTGSMLGLVWGTIASVVLEVFISMRFIKPIPKIKFELSKARKIVRRGKWITFAGMFSYLFTEGDDIAVGKLLNSASLGIYRVAYRISTLPLTEITLTVRNVAFPLFVKIADDKRKLRKVFVRTFLGVSLVVIPFGLVLYSFPNEIVLIILGDKWSDAVPVVRLLAAFGVIRALTSMTYPLFLAVKRQEYVTTTTLAGIVGLGISIIPLTSSFGVMGAGYSALIGALFAIPVSLILCLKSLK